MRRLKLLSIIVASLTTVLGEYKHQQDTRSCFNTKIKLKLSSLNLHFVWVNWYLMLWIFVVHFFLFSAPVYITVNFCKLFVSHVCVELYNTWNFVERDFVTLVRYLILIRAQFLTSTSGECYFCMVKKSLRSTLYEHLDYSETVVYIICVCRLIDVQFEEL